jgi:hypothetical protein
MGDRFMRLNTGMTALVTISIISVSNLAPIILVVNSRIQSAKDEGEGVECRRTGTDKRRGNIGVVQHGNIGVVQQLQRNRQKYLKHCRIH